MKTEQFKEVTSFLFPNRTDAEREVSDAIDVRLWVSDGRFLVSLGDSEPINFGYGRHTSASGGTPADALNQALRRVLRQADETSA